jgi:hypothetical protein
MKCRFFSYFEVNGALNCICKLSSFKKIYLKADVQI